MRTFSYIGCTDLNTFFKKKPKKTGYFAVYVCVMLIGTIFVDFLVEKP